jgi:hypothetical protein
MLLLKMALILLIDFCFLIAVAIFILMEITTSQRCVKTIGFPHQNFRLVIFLDTHCLCVLFFFFSLCLSFRVAF